MKLTKISLGVAAACGIMSAPAHALLASSYTNTGEFVGDTINIRISGTSSLDSGLLTSFLNSCRVGSMTRYSISNNFVYYCYSYTQGSKTALYKYSVGGSGSGVGPVNSAAALPFLDLAKIATSCFPGASSSVDVDGTGPLSTFQDIVCGAASGAVTTNAVSYIGLSDVEPEFFGGPSTNNNLRAYSLASVIFGVPVTRNIYEALQGQQGLTVGATDEANMPSLSQAQLTSMYTQEGQSWNNLTGATVGDDLVYVVRRVDSSGTQKAFEALIARSTNGTNGGRECQSQVESFVSGPEALTNTQANALCNGANLVVNGSGSGQVIACLNAHHTAGRGAIGILTTETNQAAGGLWRFVKINGIAPTHAGVASGAYTQYADASIIIRDFDAMMPTYFTRGYATFLNGVRSAFANASFVAVSNGLPQTFGASGLMALDSLESPLPAPDFTGASGRNPWSRLVNGSDLNNCQPGKLAAF